MSETLTVPAVDTTPVPPEQDQDNPSVPTTPETPEAPAGSEKKVTVKPKAAVKKTAKPKKPAAKKAIKKVDNTTLLMTQIELSEEWDRDELGDISGLVESIREVGLLDALLVQPTANPKKFLLLHGRRRYAALTEVGTKRVPVTFDNDTSGKDKKDLAKMLAANNVRKDLTAYELARVLDQLAAKGYSNEELAKVCGKSTGFVSQHRAVWHAPKELQDALREGTIKVSLFRHLNKLGEDDHKFYDKVAEAALKGIPATKLGDKVDGYLAKKAEKAGKDGKKATPKPKRGGAAHKSKAELTIRNYEDKEVQRAVTMVTKTTALGYMTEYADRLRQATKRDKQRYYQGVLDGLEMAGGLTED